MNYARTDWDKDAFANDFGDFFFAVFFITIIKNKLLVNSHLK